MQDSGPLIALVAFIILSLVFGFFTYQSYGQLEGDSPEGDEATSTRMDAQIRKAQAEVEDVEKQIRALESDLAAARDQLVFQRARFEYAQYLVQGDGLNGLYERAHKARLGLVDAGKKFETAATDLGTKIKEQKDKTKGVFRTEETEIREKSEASVKKLQEEKDASLARVAAEKQALDRDEKTFRQNKNYEQSALDEYKRQLDYLTSREVERATVLNEPDGKVLTSDPVHNTVIINLGTAHGVRNGWRFEVFAWKPGNRKVHKAFIEVRKASVDVSDCFILQKPVKLPRDPLSNYVSSQPEELWSPYQESGRAGALLQGLTADPKTVKMGMAFMDPIVVDDYVQNPFFSPGKTYTFYIAGDKTIQQGNQRSAIAYQWPQIERVLESYGAKVLKKTDLSVNYVLAQKNPQDDPEYNRAVSLGIPVLYEWEVFRFLNQD
jgi:cell division protein FtsB/anion-transporting  ArsA/GET3 family ATPase